MDAKERWIIEKLHAKIIQGTYDEIDILAFLITLRESVRKGSLIREFGDFIAHRSRDRGILKEYLERLRHLLQNPMKSNSSIEEVAVYSVYDIQRSLNDLLASIGLSPFGEEIANQVTVCLISLLQFVKVRTKAASSVNSLVIGISSDFIALLGQGHVPAGHVIAFPMLVARNNYLPLPGVDTWMILDNFVTKAYSVGGQFRLEQRKRMS